MYEQNEAPVFRRILWIVLGFIVAVAVIWLLVWLIFFRNSSPAKVAAPHKPTTQHQPATKQPSGSTNPAPNSSGTSGNSTPSSTAPAAGPGTPSQLANTGAGNVVAPFVAASIAGGTLYYVRLRKKLLMQH